MSPKPSSSPEHVRPVQDEWGIFDPSQAGLTELFRRVVPAPRDETDATHTHS